MTPVRMSAGFRDAMASGTDRAKTTARAGRPRTADGWRGDIRTRVPPRLRRRLVQRSPPASRRRFELPGRVRESWSWPIEPHAACPRRFPRWHRGEAARPGLVGTRFGHRATRLARADMPLKRHLDDDGAERVSRAERRREEQHCLARTHPASRPARERMAVTRGCKGQPPRREHRGRPATLPR